MDYSRDRAEVRFEACFHSFLLFYFQFEFIYCNGEQKNLKFLFDAVATNKMIDLEKKI